MWKREKRRSLESGRETAAGGGTDQKCSHICIGHVVSTYSNYLLMETEVELARIVERIECESMRNLECSYIYDYVLSGIYGLVSPRIPLLRFQGSLRSASHTQTLPPPNLQRHRPRAQISRLWNRRIPLRLWQSKLEPMDQRSQKHRLLKIANIPSDTPPRTSAKRDEIRLQGFPSFTKPALWSVNTMVFEDGFVVVDHVR